MITLRLSKKGQQLWAYALEVFIDAWSRAKYFLTAFLIFFAVTFYVLTHSVLATISAMLLFLAIVVFLHGGDDWFEILAAKHDLLE